MKTFDVYKHPIQGYQAVKQGFCWPALFFTIIWAFAAKMWALGFTILGIIFTLSLVETVAEGFQPQVSVSVPTPSKSPSYPRLSAHTHAVPIEEPKKLSSFKRGAVDPRRARIAAGIAYEQAGLKEKEPLVPLNPHKEDDTLGAIDVAAAYFTQHTVFGGGTRRAGKRICRRREGRWKGSDV
ncbi:MAG: hypothetical protein COA65_01390 [Rhodospirillaceae bacterium]|nr:MAG: hypothetical protein COA65_01390 [Rhodospirillaceae bacterium]